MSNHLRAKKIDVLTQACVQLEAKVNLLRAILKEQNEILLGVNERLIALEKPKSDLILPQR